MDRYEKAERDILAAEARGEITQEEASQALRELHREYREDAKEAAERAFNDERSRWE